MTITLLSGMLGPVLEIRRRHTRRSFGEESRSRERKVLQLCSMVTCLAALIT